MTMPTVGRIMWFYQGKYPTSQIANLVSVNNDQPFKADITYVHHDNLVNALITDHFGNQAKARDIPIVQEDSPYQIGTGATIYGYLMWMPYQIQQHKKHESDIEQTRGINPNYEGGLVAKAQKHTFDVTRETE